MTFITISGPSGAGKSTLLYNIKYFLGGTKLLPSFTTRLPRQYSSIDQIYIHLSEEEYLEKEARMDFLLSEQVAGNYYGTRLTDVELAINSSNIYLSDLTAKSVLELIELSYVPDLCIIVDIDIDISLHRMQLRGDSEFDIERRLNRYLDETYNCNKLTCCCKNYLRLNGADSVNKIKNEAFEVIAEMQDIDTNKSK